MTTGSTLCGLSQRMERADEEVAVADGNDLRGFPLDAVDDAVVADENLADVGAVQLAHDGT